MIIFKNIYLTIRRTILLIFNKIKIYNMKSTVSEESVARIDTLSPMSQAEMKIDGTTTLFLNSKKEEISRWESIFDEDLKDGSFQPEKNK